MPADPPPFGLRAVVCDVFGTVVDWRSSVIREGQELGRRLGLEADWAAFADAWRGRYRPAMDRVRRGEQPWTNLDGLHRASLDELLAEFGLETLDEDERDHLNRAWHRLDPWPDSVPGLTRLRRRYVTGTFSNGNVALLVNMARRGGLPWDVILSAELVHAYKPDPAFYLSVPALLAMRPDEVMLAAAHPDDLRAAQGHGLRAAYVPRPLEHGPGREAELADPAFDVVARDFEDLAARLGA